MTHSSGWAIFFLSCMAATATRAQAGPPQPPSQAAVGSGQSTAASSSEFPLNGFTEFSAIMIGSRVGSSNGAAEGHIYRSGNLMRMEDPGRGGYYITDLGSGETYGISETGCIHDWHPFVRVFPFDFGAKKELTVTRSPLGKDTVDGHACKVEEISISSEMSPAAMKMKFWEADDLRGFPVRIVFLLPGGHEAVVKYKDVVLGPQDPTLFLHSKTCEELGKPE